MGWSPFTPKCDSCRKNKINRKDPAIVVLDCLEGEVTKTLCDECMEYLQMYAKPAADE